MKPHEFWRDAETLGSLFFYLAVLARSLAGLHWPFFFELLLAFILGELVQRMTRASSHAVRGAILFVLINNFYWSGTFLLLSTALFAIGLIGHIKVRKHSLREIILGLAIGFGCAGIVLWSIPLR